MANCTCPADHDHDWRGEQREDGKPGECDLCDCVMTAEQNIETNKKNLKRAAKWIGIPLAGLIVIGLFTDSPEPTPAPEPQPVVQTVEPTVEPAPTPEITETPPVVEESVYYDSCDDVRAAGAAPIHIGEPGYGDHLDRDGDGSACES